MIGILAIGLFPFAPLKIGEILLGYRKDWGELNAVLVMSAMAWLIAFPVLVFGTGHAIQMAILSLVVGLVGFLGGIISGLCQKKSLRN